MAVVDDFYQEISGRLKRVVGGGGVYVTSGTSMIEDVARTSFTTLSVAAAASLEICDATRETYTANERVPELDRRAEQGS